MTRNEMLSNDSPCLSAASAAIGNISAAAALLVTCRSGKTQGSHNQSISSD
jgi:hypothetical protein